MNYLYLDFICVFIVITIIMSLYSCCTYRTEELEERVKQLE